MGTPMWFGKPEGCGHSTAEVGDRSATNLSTGRLNARMARARMCSADLVSAVAVAAVEAYVREFNTIPIAPSPAQRGGIILCDLTMRSLLNIICK